MPWDGVRGRYVLTGTGRRRISQGRAAVGSGALRRKSANTNLKEWLFERLHFIDG
jgi:hypothetical protein